MCVYGFVVEKYKGIVRFLKIYVILGQIVRLKQDRNMSLRGKIICRNIGLSKQFLNFNLVLILCFKQYVIEVLGEKRLSGVVLIKREWGRYL